MKKSAVLLTLLVVGYFQAVAQHSFDTREYIDIGNIKAPHLVHGDMWWNTITSELECEFPAGSGKSLGGLGSLWMSGFDAQNNLHLSAQMLRQNDRNDYWPGPAQDPVYTDAYQRASAWARIWKINRATLEAFRTSTEAHTIASTPAVILEWPAKGNALAKGDSSRPLTINREMAPFIDVNNDGIYNALQGDYPSMKGDQMLWWVITDNGPTHSQTDSLALGIEIANTVYAYSRGTAVDNIIFYEYQVTNKSGSGLKDYRFGLNTDIDLGFAADDYVAYDSTRRMGISYNAGSIDGNGEFYAYGSDIPAVGIAFLEMPSDQNSFIRKTGSFINYDNGHNANGTPRTAVEYNNLLRGQSIDSLVTLLTYGLDSIHSSMCYLQLPPADIRYVLASTSDSLAPDQMLKYALALVVAPHSGGCPATDFTSILATADAAKNIYSNPLPVGVKNTVALAHSLHIYPNPTASVLYLDVPDGAEGVVHIYDVSGKFVHVKTTKQGRKITVETNLLAPGVYMIEYRSGETLANNVFVKQ